MNDSYGRSPEIDPFLQSDGYQNYGLDLEGLWTGKQACKAALQRELGLPEDPYACMLGGAVRLFTPPPRLHSVLVHKTPRAHSLFTPPPHLRA